MTAESLLWVLQARQTRTLPLQSISGPYQTRLTALDMHLPTPRTASSRHQSALHHSKSQQVVRSRRKVLLVLALICLPCLTVMSPAVIPSDVHSMVHELDAICSSLHRS
jgi:hypothetical protein